MNCRGLLTRAGARLSRDERGFSMVELVAAMLIFAIVILGVATGMSTALNLTRNNRNRSIAANLASQEIDTVRSTDFALLPVGQIQNVVSVDGVPYTVTRDTEWVTQSATSGPCQAPPGSNLAFLRVSVSVTWQNMTGVKPPASQTVVTPPVGTFDPNTGHIGVTVRDRDTLPNSGILVTLAGPVNQSQITTSDGCAFFAYLPAGSYTATASAAGHVDDQGVASPMQSATVTVGTTTSLEFLFDQAATLSLTFKGSATGVLGPSSLPVYLYNTAILPNGLKLFPGAGNPRTIPSLFPFLSGYQVSLGDCLDADPEGESSPGNPFYPGATRGAAVPTTPGATTNADVAIGEVAVHVQNLLGNPVPNSEVHAIHALDSGCPSGYDLVLGTTDVNGNLAGALPWGSWDIQASLVSAGGPVTLDPTAPPGAVNVTVIL